MPVQRCALEGCAGLAMVRRGICYEHWKGAPEDLRRRLRWALYEGDDMDMLAALEAINEAMR